MTYITAAFDAICTEAKEPETWYVCLVSSYQRYGGPEEGGWWQTMNEIVKYQEFMSEELANSAAGKIRALAEELTAASRAEHGQHCLNQLDWLEARGLDADYLPENDGPNEFSVCVCDELPSYDNTLVGYE